eukprot:2562652-Pleurochrysis_carterae.AAC.4
MERARQLASKQVQAMKREQAKGCTEVKQEGARKSARRAYKAGVHLFTALEPPLGSNPNSLMR